MKTHTTGFKENLIELGRELRGVITYGNTTLEEEIYSITPHYNADLLKSVMKQLDIELSVDIPLNTIINCQIGIKVNEQYEMLNYGNYVVYKSEKQEDTNTYKLTCYDKMLYSMKQNEDLGVDYPIKIKDYLIALGNKIGLSVANTTFYNQDMKIPSELYLGQEYTYRDILDEIAQATGSIICLNENDEIQVKYPTKTNDTIDEEFLKDINVDFGQKYGVINSIVLSRSGESDNVYLRDEDSVAQNGLTEVKIVDNQIMNFNNRSDYLQGILNALNGLYYYLNDFNSTGILYYEVGDLYNVKIGENTYQCLMLNDEINVTTGIEEIIHTDMPEKSETDYEKADKTDRRINQTYLIVDKQNQRIDSVVSNVSKQNNKISQITQTVDEINSKISDIADITTYGESDRAEVELKDINKSEPIMIKVHPTSTNISYLYPRENLYPSDLQYLPNRIIRFTRTYEKDGTTKTENIDYELPDDLLRYSSEVYDEFYLDYDSHTCQVIKRCAYNADGTVRALGTEITTDYEYPTILLGKGNYTITLPGYDFGYIYARLMAKNIYTKVETDSRINQKADEINLGVSQKLTNYSTTNEMNSAIDVKEKAITSSVSKKYVTNTTLTTNYSTTEATKNMINKAVGSSEEVLNEKISKVEQSSYDIKETFSSTGGNNLIYNSVGYFKSSDGKILNWTQTDGTNPLLEYGEAYNYYLNNSNAISKGVIHLRNGKLVSDSIRIATNRDLTISFKYKVSNDTKVTLSVENFISETFSAETDWQTYTKTFNSRNTNNVQITIDTTSTYTEADDGFYITDLMLNYGNESIPWEFHQGETYNANIRMSSDGIEVGNSASDTISVYGTQGTIIYKNDNGQKGEINTQYTSKSTIERNVEILENMVQDGSSQKLVHSMINSNNNEVFVEYII